MHRLRRIQSLLGALFRKRQLENDMDDEMHSHIEMQTQENIAAEMKPEEAAPAFAGKNVYARNDQELVCASLAANSYRTDKRGR